MIKIRQASEEDIYLINYLEEHSFEECDRFSFKELKSYFYQSNGMCIIIEYNSLPAGYALAVKMTSKKATLVSICIDKKYQGKGIGKTLLFEIDNIIQQNGFTESVLETREINNKMINMCEKEGYVFLKKVIDYYPDAINGNKNAIKMIKRFI